MRVLFASTQGTGHFGPLIPLIDACRADGHEALIVGPPTLKARGYPFEAGDAPPEEVLGPLWAAMPTLPPAQGDVVVVAVVFAKLNVEAMLPKHREVIERWRPDLVVRESAEFASAVAAEEHEIRHVRVASTTSGPIPSPGISVTSVGESCPSVTSAPLGSSSGGRPS